MSTVPAKGTSSYSDVHRTNQVPYHLPSQVNQSAQQFNQPQLNGRPPKYIKVNGVTQLNPEWKRFQQGQPNQPVSTALNPDTALPVVCNMDDHADLCAISTNPVPLAPEIDNAIMRIQQPQMCAMLGVSEDNVVDDLGRLFARYEVPLGMLNKLLALSELQELEFIMDDSGSMSTRSRAPDGVYRSRWEEAQMRLKELIEILAWIPIPPITIRFLNGSYVISLRRSGEHPQAFIANAYHQIDSAFARQPGGGTPVLERLEESFSRGYGKRVGRYLFCDGEPNGGQQARERITDLLKNRVNPKDNPVTLCSCTDDDDEVEWMKEAEEIAPYCSEYDDFISEAKEVQTDQGNVLPFTKGFYLVGSLVGAMNPDDLDAMDESAPFTKTTLEGIMGVTMTEQDYRRYFDGMRYAQSIRPQHTNADKLKREMNWDAYFSEFLTAPVARNIPIVQWFKLQLEGRANYPKPQPSYGAGAYGQSPYGFQSGNYAPSPMPGAYPYAAPLSSNPPSNMMMSGGRPPMQNMPGGYPYMPPGGGPPGGFPQGNYGPPPGSNRPGNYPPGVTSQGPPMPQSNYGPPPGTMSQGPMQMPMSQGNYGPPPGAMSHGPGPMPQSNYPYPPPGAMPGPGGIPLPQNRQGGNYPPAASLLPGGPYSNPSGPPPPMQQRPPMGGYQPYAPYGGGMQW